MWDRHEPSFLIIMGTLEKPAAGRQLEDIAERHNAANSPWSRPLLMIFAHRALASSQSRALLGSYRSNTSTLVQHCAWLTILHAKAANSPWSRTLLGQ